MNFGQALEALKAGSRVSRAGWNGKGMWLTLLRPGVEMARSVGGPDGDLSLDPCIAMRTAGGTLQPGWLANQADMLAEDWDDAELLEIAARGGHP